MTYLENNIEWIEFPSEWIKIPYYKTKILESALNMCFDLTYEKILNNK